MKASGASYVDFMFKITIFFVDDSLLDLIKIQY